MLREVFGVEQDVYTVKTSKICRDKQSVKLYNKKEKKRYSMVYTKQVIWGGYCTVPYRTLYIRLIRVFLFSYKYYVSVTAHVQTSLYPIYFCSKFDL